MRASPGRWTVALGATLRATLLAAPRHRRHGCGVATANRTRRRPKSTYHHGDLRKALLEEARVLIREGGLGSFTLREVARRVGVTHAAAYRHFADKNALAVEIAETGYAELTRIIGAPLDSSDDLTKRLDELSQRYVTFALRHQADYRARQGMPGTDRKTESKPLAIASFLSVFRSVPEPRPRPVVAAR